MFVDPEHLKDPKWRKITEWPVFQANIVFACVDEAHLIYKWGLDFRLAFFGSQVESSKQKVLDKHGGSGLDL